MGPPDSRGVPRAPRYSGSWRASLGFAYRPFTVCGATFQTLPLAPLLPLLQSYNPDATGIAPVWALPRSLATTGGITFCFLFLWVLRCFSSPGSPPPTGRMAVRQTAGLPHSGTPGSKTACVSPGLFAACRALHRLPEPQASAVRPFLLSPVPNPQTGRRDAYLGFGRAATS